ncbi:MAG TPA: 50S ribosomal protein L32 [Candidatus Magasanikbacteria bacterium]|nr:50S ribosomal protein L32 [Candidatus Magasanikbacteria bacterium]
MGLPSKQRTRTSKRQRASHFALSKKAIQSCPSCGAPALPHTACPSCGLYRGKKAANVEKRTARRAKRIKKIH